MSKKPTLNITRTSAKEYVLEVSAGISPSGKRQRLKFTSRAKAELQRSALLKRAGDFGVERALMTPKVEREAVAAAKLLKPFGVTILQAARAMVEKLDMERRSPSLADLIEEYAVEAEKDKTSAGHVDSIRWGKNKAQAIFGDALACNLETQDLLDGIRSIQTVLELSAKSQRHFHGIISSAYNLGVRKKYFEVNPLDKQKKVRLEDQEIGTLSIIQAQALLNCAGDVLPAIALSMFAGFRASEVRRLQWEDFGWKKKTIRLRGSSGRKEKKGRFVRLEPCLAQWLLPFKATEGLAVSLGNRQLRERLREVRAFADAVLTEAGNEGEATLISDWDRNTLRHTAISYWRNAGRTEEEVTRWAGHGAGIHETNYRAVIEEGAGKAFFKLTPDLKLNVVAM